MADVAGPPPEDVFHDHIEDQPCKDEPLEESDDQVADLIGLERPAREAGSSSPPSNHSAIAESSPSSHRRSARSAGVPSAHPPWSSITVTRPPPRSRAVPSLPGIRGSSRHPPPPRCPPDGTRRRRVAPRPSRRAHATGNRPPSPSVQEPSPPPATALAS